MVDTWGPHFVHVGQECGATPLCPSLVHTPCLVGPGSLPLDTWWLHYECALCWLDHDLSPGSTTDNIAPPPALSPPMQVGLGAALPTVRRVLDAHPTDVDVVKRCMLLLRALACAAELKVRALLGEVVGWGGMCCQLACQPLLRNSRYTQPYGQERVGCETPSVQCTCECVVFPRLY